MTLSFLCDSVEIVLPHGLGDAHHDLGFVATRSVVVIKWSLVWLLWSLQNTRRRNI